MEVALMRNHFHVNHVEGMTAAANVWHKYICLLFYKLELLLTHIKITNVLETNMKMDFGFQTIIYFVFLLKLFF